MKRQRFVIGGMSCAACAMRLQALEDRLPGVVSVDASYRKACMDVEYDERQLTEEEIRVAVRELGYEAMVE